MADRYSVLDIPCFVYLVISDGELRRSCLEAVVVKSSSLTSANLTSNLGREELHISHHTTLAMYVVISDPRCCFQFG